MDGNVHFTFYPPVSDSSYIFEKFRKISSKPIIVMIIIKNIKKTIMYIRFLIQLPNHFVYNTYVL
jgi:hypothetical protein